MIRRTLLVHTSDGRIFRPPDVAPEKAQTIIHPLGNHMAFPVNTAKLIAERSAYICNNPECNRLTIGPAASKNSLKNEDLVGWVGFINPASKFNQKRWVEGANPAYRTAGQNEDIDIPRGFPRFLGYVRQQHNVRNNETGMTRGWTIFGERVEEAVHENIVEKLRPLDQIIEWDDESYDLGSIPNLHSLIPYSQEARKPIFDCGTADGLTGAHVRKAAESIDLFSGMTEVIVTLRQP